MDRTIIKSLIGSWCFTVAVLMHHALSVHGHELRHWASLPRPDLFLDFADSDSREGNSVFIRGQILGYGVYSSTARWVLVGSIDHAAQVRVGLKTAI